MSIDSLIDRAKRALPGAAADLENLRSAPEVVVVRAREDGERQARRAQLLKDLAALPGQYRDRLAKAVQARDAAAARVQQAEDALLAARTEHMRLAGAVGALDHQQQHAFGRLTRELLDTADPRLHDCLTAAVHLAGRARACFATSAAIERVDGLGYPRGTTVHNANLVAAALRACNETAEACRSAMGLALDRQQITVLLRPLLQQMADALLALEIRCAPTMGDDGSLDLAALEAAP